MLDIVVKKGLPRGSTTRFICSFCRKNYGLSFEKLVESWMKERLYGNIDNYENNCLHIFFMYIILCFQFSQIARNTKLQPKVNKCPALIFTPPECYIYFKFPQSDFFYPILF